MKLAAVGDVCDLVNGKAFKPSDWAITGEPIIRIQNLNDPDKPFNHWEGPLDRQVRVCTGDVLLAWSGTPGTSFGVHIWDRRPGILNQHIFRVDLDSKSITKAWFKYAVNGQLNRLIAQAHGGVGLQHVTRRMVDELAIPLPPLNEQRRITAVLDKADALRRKRKRALALLDSLTQSIFLEMFGDGDWAACLRRVRLGDLLVGIDSGWSPVCLDRSADAQETGVLKLSCISRSGYLFAENKALPPELAPKKALEVMAGDVLFARKNTKELVGSSVYVWETRPRLFLSDLIFRLKPKLDLLDPLFLQVQLSVERKRRELSDLAGGVAGSMPNISKGRLAELEIFVAPMSSQAVFRASCEKCRILIRFATKSLFAADRLFASLQSRAFAGQL